MIVNGMEMETGDDIAKRSHCAVVEEGEEAGKVERRTFLCSSVCAGDFVMMKDVEKTMGLLPTSLAVVMNCGAVLQ